MKIIASAAAVGNGRCSISQRADARTPGRPRTASGAIEALPKVLTSFCVASALGLLWQTAAQAQAVGNTAPSQSFENVLAVASPAGPKLTVSRVGGVGHVFPTAQSAAKLSATSDKLVYNGGPVITTATIYSIFWAPPNLQNGTKTTIPPHYQQTLSDFADDYIGHGIANNNTQYYQPLSPIAVASVVGPITGPFPTVNEYIQNAGQFGGVYVEKTAFPSGGCSYTFQSMVAPGNCVNDSQIQQQILNTMNKAHWTGGLDKIFLVYTSPGEGSCFDSYSGVCAYNYYCGYHSFIAQNSQNLPIIYAVLPYGVPSVCSTTFNSPNSDVAADTVASVASHEITEAITDPFPGSTPAWITSAGLEIGDLCAYQYGNNDWKAGTANQMWNGNFYEIQMEYSNHASACVQLGP